MDRPQKHLVRVLRRIRMRSPAAHKHRPGRFRSQELFRSARIPKQSVPTQRSADWEQPLHASAKSDDQSEEAFPDRKSPRGARLRRGAQPHHHPRAHRRHRGADAEPVAALYSKTRVPRSEAVIRHRLLPSDARSVRNRSSNQRKRPPR